MPEHRLIYLASPYSHPDSAIQESRFIEVCRVAAAMMREGHLIFSPIAHSHPIAMAGSLPTDWEFWRKYDHAMLDAASELWVLKIPGWDESQGVQAEIVYAIALGKPIIFQEVSRWI